MVIGYFYIIRIAFNVMASKQTKSRAMEKQMLLMSESLNGIEPGRLAGREIAENNAHCR